MNKKSRNSWEWIALAAATFIVFVMWTYDSPPRVNADANAGTNVSSSAANFYAWNDIIGWIDLHYTHSVTVLRTKIEGYASSSVGDISFDCATTRSGNICGSSNYYVINDGVGNLSGWGWNDTYGWISFCGGLSSADCPGATNYRVLLTATGTAASVMSGYAWNDVAGWVSFNCADPGVCGTADYKVITSWIATSTEGTLESTTFDTGISSGVQLNSFFWQGARPAGTSAYFQFAGSNASSGPWSYKGDDGTSNSWYSPAPDTSSRLRFSDFTNVRYFRYKVRLITNQGQTETPRVDDVILNWSP
jgi:hypothetical protein